MILLVISLFHLYLKRKTWIYIYRERDVWGFKGPGNRRLTVHICHQTLFVFWLLAELPPGIPQCPLASQQVRPEPCPSPPGPLNPLYCVSQDRRIRHVPLIPPLYCTPVQPEALLGVHLVGVMWRVPAIWTKITIYAHNQRNWAFSQVTDKSVTQCIHRQGQSKFAYVFS